ncbi:13536_t:CDS:1, partial [Funneliformis caledonium]
RIIPEGLFESTIISLLRNCGESEVESRNINIEPKKVNIESSIITYRHAELITKWIEKLEITDEITASYEFKLLSRSQGGDVRFSSKFPTITIIKVKGTDEILGGYSPIAWPRGTIFYSVFTYRTSKDSFIFSFEDIIDINSHILSRVKNEQHAIAFHFFSHYFSFGITDLSIGSSYGSCQMNDYEKPIRETVDNFEIEICEIFLITKINGND